MYNYLLLCFLLFSWLNFNMTQDSLTFSPSTPLCIGELVQMTCFVESPTAEQFIADTALLSFNGSAPVAPNVITVSSSIDGIDVSRYTASSDGLTISNERPGVRLNISDYQASDGYIEFGCHGVYSGVIPSPVIISSQPQRLARPVLLTSSTLTVKSNISRDSDIFVSVQHDLSTVDRPDTLSYNLSLYVTDIYGNITKVDDLNQLTPAQAISTPFSTKFELDNYYHTSVIADDCVAASGSVDSKTFVLIGLQSDNGTFQTSSSNASRIEWVYTNLETPAGGFEQDYLSEDYFNFTIDSEIITEFSLYLPQRFDFALPPGYDSSSRQGLLKISFNGISFANITVLVEQDADNILTIVLIIFLVLLVILLGVIVVITVIFVVIYYKKRQNVKK